MYTINITGTPFPFMGSPLTYVTDSSYPATTDLSLEITGLEEYNNYTVSIAAVNSVGTGPYSTGDTQRTNQFGKIILCIYRNLEVYLNRFIKYILIDMCFPINFMVF